MIDEWSFTLEPDDLVVPAGPVGTDENLRLAFETLIIPFGTSPERVLNYLQEWRRMGQEYGSNYILGTSSATVKKLDGGHAEIGDLYGQFTTVTISVECFESALESLVRFLAHDLGIG